jgi:hypothetical protein
MIQMQRTRGFLVPALCAALLAGALAAPSAIGRRPSPKSHAASGFMTGIGDDSAAMLRDTYWTRLHTRIVRYIVPYDTAVRPYWLQKAYAYIKAAEAMHQQVLIAFYHSEYTPTRMPSVRQYKHDVQKFVRMFPRVHQYQSWDEANRGNIRHYLSSPSASAAARYYQALLRVCTSHCTVIGLDVLDQENIASTLHYIAAFKREVRQLHTVMPKIWGLHNYSDVNRLQSWRTRALVRALGGQVWLTETGGIVKFGGAFPNRRGSGLSRAARVLKYMFALAHAIPKVKRLYIYNWLGGNHRARFDAGLMNAHQVPRPGYEVVCRALHAGSCKAKLAKN